MRLLYSFIFEKKNKILLLKKHDASEIRTRGSNLPKWRIVVQRGKRLLGSGSPTMHGELFSDNRENKI